MITSYLRFSSFCLLLLPYSLLKPFKLGTIIQFLMSIGVSEISQILLRNRFLCTQSYCKLFSALPDVFNSVLKSETCTSDNFHTKALKLILLHLECCSHIYFYGESLWKEIPQNRLHVTWDSQGKQLYCCLLNEEMVRILIQSSLMSSYAKFWWKQLHLPPEKFSSYFKRSLL